MSRKRPAPSPPAADVEPPATPRRSLTVWCSTSAAPRSRRARTRSLANSTYFKSIFREGWPDDDYFLDRDPATFSLLLTCMRTGVVELPEHDESLARRVLLEAQFLGMDGFLSAIKAQAYRNLEAEDWKGTDADAVKNFDKSTAGSRTHSGRVCCRRASTGACRRRRRRRRRQRIVQIMPASHDVRICYRTGTDFPEEEEVTLPAISLALVENPRMLDEHFAAGEGDGRDRYELDAFVCEDDEGVVALATEAFHPRVRWIELVPKDVSSSRAVG